MLDRLLMSILRKDEDLRNKTIELEKKFTIIETISYCRCQFYILGGRTGLVESKRIFLAETVETLEDMAAEWASKVAHFQGSVTIIL